MAFLLKILHLDDDPLDIELAMGTLRADGLDVQFESVATLPEFKAALKDRPFDLILGDYRVPGVDPLQALQLANELRPDVPFVFLSGTISEDLAIEMLKHGATDYVFKHRMDRLVPAVRRALQEAAEQMRRRKAEEEARMFKFFSENANDGHILFNHETRILYANKLASERLGYTQEELRQLTVPDIDPAFPKERVQGLFQKLREGSAKPFEGIHKRKDGSTFPVEITCTVLEVEGQSLMFGTSRDISERKQAEEALRESEDRLRLALEAADLGTWDVDLITGRTVRSLRHDQIFGYQELQPEWSIEIALEHVLPEDQPIWQEAFARAQKSGALSFEARVRWPDDSIHWIAPLGRTSYDSEGRAVRLTGIVADITERKQTEQALRESEQEARALSRSLEQRVAKRTSELEEKNLRLRRLAAELTTTEQRERKRLAALLHDDLQQLLVAAGMDLNVLKKRMRGANDIGAVERAGDWIAKATSAARDLTSQLRPPALYEGGFVAALHWLASQTWDRHRVRITIEGEEPVNPIGDETNALLFDCVREVVFNLVKHAGVDEGVVTVREGEECLRIRVQDKGKGFDVEPIANGQGHSGFGLFSIRERLLSLGCDVSIVSAKGKGTQVELKVPLSVTAIEKANDAYMNSSTTLNTQPNKTPDSKTDQRVRVLVVDDHAMVRQGLATIIDGDDRMTVVGEAADGLQAIEAFEEHHPSVILIDVNMPRMSGIDATQEICRRWPDSIVIGLSVQDDEATAKLMRRAGAKAFLSKVGDADHMIATIIALCSNGERPVAEAGCSS